jgi:phosphocarrier protein HPr
MSESCNAIVKNERGIHARPSSVIAKEALKYKSNVMIHYNGKSASAKDVLQIIMLELFVGSVVLVTAQGEDEKIACVEVKNAVEKAYNFE